nr:MAG: hypothetical protein [Microviridae sp.]
METRLYVVYDLVALESGPIFEAKNDGVALRQFGQLMAKTEFPHEFELRYIGDYCHDYCKIEVAQVTTVVASVDTEFDRG